MDSRQAPHVLLVVFPIQSHINPAYQFAAQLLSSGAHVTIATTISLNMSGGAAPSGLLFATISDGNDEVCKDYRNFKRRGSETLSELISSGPPTGSPPYSFVVYTILLSWAADVARLHALPVALLWIQNATLFAIYYHYFNGYGDLIKNCYQNGPNWTLDLPALPPLHARDLPSFLAPTNPYKFADVRLKEQFEELAGSENSIILVNTFDSLEHDVIESLNSKFKISSVGPLLPKTPSSAAAALKVEIFTNPSQDDCMAWLDTQLDKSVVYVSFGSVSLFSKAQKEEMVAALLETKLPFLWVIRKSEMNSEGNGEVEEMTSCFIKLMEMGTGIVVTWCSQLKVLSHKAVGCFVTHCGWNSTLESLTKGVPVVAIPQWTDQLTNAWMLDGVWGVGVRVRVEGEEEEKVVGREELRRCVEEVMGSCKMKDEATRWQEKAVQAMTKNGSSDVNVRAFVKEIWKNV